MWRSGEQLSWWSPWRTPLVLEQRRDLMAEGRRMSCCAGRHAFEEDEAIRALLKNPRRD